MKKNKSLSTASIDDIPSQAGNSSRPEIGVLLLNLGTPDNLDIKSIKRYLTEFLLDKRVIDIARIIWYPLLYGIILRKRPPKTLKAYERIWDKEQNDSPLRLITKQQAELLQARLESKLENLGLRADQIKISFAMRYGKPNIADQIDELIASGCKKILFFPLYPQYCAATTASAYDKLFSHLTSLRDIPSLRIVPPYYDNEEYIKTIGDSIVNQLKKQKHPIEKLLVCFHSIPKRYVTLGDPYEEHCQKTTEKLIEYLNWDKDRVSICFQSRFGKEEWLKPYADEHLIELSKAGIKSIAMVSPGFAADCLETLDEIAIEYARLFKEHGGEHFTYIPCLNSSEASINLLENITLNELNGWLIKQNAK